MGSVNWQKVIVGGLVAGIVFAVLDYVLQSYVVGPMVAGMTGAATMAAVSKREMIGYPLSDILYAITIVWLYAAIRPRYGAGAKTAACAALAVWFTGSIAYGSYYLSHQVALAPFCVMAIAALIEFQVAGYIGGMMYSEGGAG